MTYTIKWKPKPFKFLDKLPNTVALRIWNKVGMVIKNPFRFLERHEGSQYHKLRVGDYRLLIDVDLKREVLLIQVLDKRGRIYKR